uniref:At4g15545-like C-terminal domain-containing protein n=1 Tax=Quercus lobata TaxID=97700 RepID=A0A7N2LGN2_QUELO
MFCFNRQLKLLILVHVTNQFLGYVVPFVKGLTFVSFTFPGCGWHHAFILLNLTDEGANGYVAHQSLTGSTDLANKTDEASWRSGQILSITPCITPRLTPTGTPKIISTSGSLRGYSSVGSPQKTSGTTSPTKPPYEGRAILSSWYPSSQQSSAANSPPRVRSQPGFDVIFGHPNVPIQLARVFSGCVAWRTPRIDGKEFFRQARSRLSYEQFSAFLVNIKELNAQKQTREETLRKAEEIFGTDNKDLYLSFQGLLNRNVR